MPHDVGNIVHTAVGMVMAILFVAFHQYPDMGAANAAFFAFFRNILDPGDTQSIQLCQHGILIGE